MILSVLLSVIIDMHVSTRVTLKLCTRPSSSTRLSCHFTSSVVFVSLNTTLSGAFNSQALEWRDGRAYRETIPYAHTLLSYPPLFLI